MPTKCYIPLAVRLYCSVLLTLVLAPLVFAQDQPFAKTHEFVDDQASVLNASDVQRLVELCRNLQTAHGYQMLIVTLSSLNGEDINHAATRYGNEQAAGRKGADTGVVIMLAMQEHKVYIATGQGTEAALTDARAASICRNTMRPLLREGRTGDALYAGAQQVVDVLEGRGESVPMPLDGDRGGGDSGGGIPAGFLVLGVGGLSLLGVLGVRYTYKCPKCGHWMSVTNQMIQAPGLLSNGYGIRTRTCPFCGFSDQTRYTIYRNSGGGFTGGGWSGGNSGGWSGGGGFSGGGGSFGGGGGGSSW